MRQIMQAIPIQLAIWMAVALAASAQAPKAVITGPKEAVAGDLVVLDASQSSGVGYMWLLVNSDKTFYAAPGGLQCVFSARTPGKYVFVLIVSGVTNNGGPDAKMASHTLTLVDPSPSPTPTPGPQPNPTPPAPGRRQVTILRETSELTPELATLQLDLQTRLRGKHSLSLLDPDGKDQDNKPSPKVSAAKAALGASSLPGLVIADEAGKVLFAGSLPATADEVLALIAKHGG